MYHKLLHIYGPFFLQSYGLCIALGLVLFSWLVYRDPLRIKLLNDDQFYWLLTIGIISAIIGGRIVYFITHDTWHSIYEIFEFWYGGFAILGSVIGVFLVIPFYLKKYSIPILPVLDCATLYAPLLQSISRIGCFLAGCCYGKPTFSLISVTYTNSDCNAPLGIALHPTQLYSSLSLFVIFCILYAFRRRSKQFGFISLTYIILIALERFTIDFFRADQTYFSNKVCFISDQQWLALFLLFFALIFLFFLRLQRTFGTRAL